MNAYPDLDLDVDPKLAWALRHPEVFPVDINKADYEMLLRVPGNWREIGKDHNRFPGVTLISVQSS